MLNKDYFKGKRITVAGLARSGLACAKLLYSLGADVNVTDNQDSDSTRACALQLKSNNIKIEIGRHSQDFIRGRDLVVVSPGIQESALPITWAKQSKIPVISEIELAWILCPASVIAVTGSNGKTTVTTLIGEMLKAAGRKAFICGNIGTPFSGEVEKMAPSDYVSLEVSSFQLERVYDFKPKVALILNLAPNHFDRHKDLQEYLEAKKRIFINQDKSDYLVLNNDDPVVREIGKEAKSNVVYFSRTPQLNPNQLAVLAVASILGINDDLCLKVFREFTGIEHRLEYVAEIKRVRFINDSKSTNAVSTVWALTDIPSPIILIAGGRDKGVDYSIVSGLLQQKARHIILIGEAKEKIKNALGGFPSISFANTLEEAVSLAFSKSEPGDTVLLSPMCSSYDMFRDYEERGKVFKKAVYDLTENK